jgi:hypothetical protein
MTNDAHCLVAEEIPNQQRVGARGIIERWRKGADSGTEQNRDARVGFSRLAGLIVGEVATVAILSLIGAEGHKT